MSRTSYWAGEPLEQFGPEAWKRIDDFYAHVRWSGLLSLWTSSHRAAFAGFHTAGQLAKVGKDGRYTKMEANEYGNLRQHIVNMVTGQRLHFDAQAKSTDHKAQSQVPISNAIAEQMIAEKGLEKVRLEAASSVQLYGEGWVVKPWTPSKGEIYSTEPVLDPQGQPILDANGQPQEKPLYAGDVEFRRAHPLDIARDGQRPSADGARWFIARRYVNRFDLMADHPEQADKIADLPSAAEEDRLRPTIASWRTRAHAGVETDEIPVWDFFHDRSPALPQGRMVTLVAPTVALFDDVLPHRVMPVFRAEALPLDGTVFGYSLFFDLLALQHGLNALLSSLVTVQAAFGVPNVWFPQGCEVQKTQIGGGLNVFEGGTAPPQPVDLVPKNPESAKLLELLRSLFSTYSGVNDVARGSAPDGVKAASALALLEARAIQFVALAQKADVQLMERVTSAALEDSQDKATEPQLVRVAGKANQFAVRQFVGKVDEANPPGPGVSRIDAITGYRIRIGNPLQETVSGRMQMADSMAEKGLIKTPGDYIQALTTGDVKPVLEAVQREEIGIVGENEMLARGELPIVGAYDDPPKHIREHYSLLAAPEARADVGLVQRVTAHVDEHKVQWQAMDPALLAALGFQPYPAPMLPPPGMGGPPGPGGGPGLAPPLPGPDAAAMSPTAGVRPAKPPKNPISGERNPQVHGNHEAM
jgi:hypothetical protein